MRTLACALLLLTAGCMDDIAGSSFGRVRNERCPGGDCWGIHSFDPPATCNECGVGRLPTSHNYCNPCADKLEKCAHCGGRKRKEPVAEAPTRRRPEPAPSQEKPPPPPVKKPDPKPEARAPQDLAIEAVDLSDAERRSDGLLVFAAERDRARLALEAHRSKKVKVIEELAPPRTGHDVGLYLVWGHHPDPAMEDGKLAAKYDPASRHIRVTTPPIIGHRKDRGIGMDWGVDRDKKWKFLGYRVKLKDLEAGDYTFEVVEAEAKDRESKVLSKGKFTLD